MRAVTLMVSSVVPTTVTEPASVATSRVVRPAASYSVTVVCSSWASWVTTWAAPQATAQTAAREAATFHAIDTLRDGTHVIIRPIRKEDAGLERAFIQRLSPESRRMRFLGQIREPSDEMLRRLTDIDYKNEMAFIALVHRDGQTQEIGVARYSTSDGGRLCECAITVSDEWHNRGLATLLMHHLIDVARTRGIRTMVSYDAIDNGQMRELATFLGFKRKADPADSSMVVHSLTL